MENNPLEQWTKAKAEEISRAIPRIDTANVGIPGTSLRMPILTEREKTHGAFIFTAGIAYDIKKAIALGDTKGAPRYVRESLDMIAVKMARIVNGDYKNEDHWTDIKGYAELALEIIRISKESDNDTEQ